MTNKQKRAGPSALTRPTSRSGVHSGASALDAEIPKELYPRLRAWYLVARRALPWRDDQPDPYRVWVSEVMSQQTGLSVVQPYFERFVTALPDLAALAHANEGILRRLWAGLGYYSRAVRLQQGARMILERLNGQFPTSYEGWLEIPGCGPYTAAAVASICFHQPQAVVDGNVMRVVSRLLAWDGDTHSSAAKTLVQRNLSKTMPRMEPGLYNQALMELGALVCRPRGPRCGSCPVQQLCSAAHQNRMNEIPRPKPRRESVRLDLTAMVFVDEACARVALWERQAGLLSGTRGFLILGTAEARALKMFSVGRLAPVTVGHAITHHRLHLHVVRFSLPHSEILAAGKPSLISSELSAVVSDRSGLREAGCPFSYRGTLQWCAEGKLDTALSSSLDQKVWRAALQADAGASVVDSEVSLS